jgi:hypothetical protein
MMAMSVVWDLATWTGVVVGLVVVGMEVAAWWGRRGSGGDERA